VRTAVGAQAPEDEDGLLEAQRGLAQRILVPPLAALARRRGLERTFHRYLDLDTHPSAEAGLGRLLEWVMERTA
jgi:hypothetical protein